MNHALRVIVGDDHPLFRQGVVTALGRETDLEVVGEASSGEEAFELAKKLAPDVVVLDVSMPGWGGVLAVEKLREAFPTLTVIMLTMSEDTDSLLAALKAGARGYVLKGIAPRELAQVLRTAHAGEIYVSPSMAGEMLVLLSKGPAQDPCHELSEREREILALIGEGLKNREIGEKIFLSEKTVKHYVSSILQKLQLRSRLEVALFAQRTRGNSPAQ
jgi:two-component system, NarL family, nitrate/nitrite response regulator NarL